MAPIDPNQLLAAFAPLLTPSGGIKNATEVPRLSSLMKKFSRKLVSRCVYCNVLLATSTDVLEEFLKSGGWETIHLWIKSAKELGNKPFLDELLKLLLILPMNVERLRENDSPKIINKLSKSEDLVLAQKAKQIVEKWTKMIELASGEKYSKDKDHKKKRKKDSIESTNSDSKDSSSDNKKPKIADKSDVNSIDVNNADSSSSNPFDSVKEEPKPKVERTPRPSTAKVKPGKSRLDGLVSSQNNAKTVKTRKELPNMTKKLSPNTSNKLLNTTNAELPQNTVPTSLAPNQTQKVKIQTIDLKPQTISPMTTTPTTTIPSTPPAVTAPATKHMLQDSTSFMDALIAPPTQLPLKKKRRTSATSTTSKDNTTTSPNIVDSSIASTSKAPSPPPKFSFYKDIIDEKVDQRVNESNPTFNDNEEDSSEYDSNSGLKDDEQNDESMNSQLNEEEMNHMNVNITVPNITTSVEPSISFTAPTVLSNTNSSNKIKPILCYIKKGSKKSVRWVDDSRLQVVRYFELDETERVNVTRPTGAGGFGELKRFDMKHEAQFMLRARQCGNNFDISDDYMSRTESFSTWKLIPCDGDTNFIEIGKDSKEREVQMERMRTTLETFYTRNQIPDSPQEPELEIFVESEAMKVIPLEDDNNPNNCHDFSNIDLPQPKTGEQLPPRIPDFNKSGPPPRIDNFAGMATPGPSFTSSSALPILPPSASNFSGGQPMIAPFGGQTLLQPPTESFAVRPSGPPQQFYPQNSGPFGAQQPDWGSGPHAGPPPQHFVPPFPNQVSHGRGMGPMGGRTPRLPRNAQNTVCKHFARTGKCRFQPKCHFLHSNDR